MKKTFYLTILTLCTLAALPVSGQAPPASVYQPLSSDQMDQLLGPVALYPDPLLAEILSAATFPTEIVVADRYIAGGGDPNQIEQQPWDASVQAVAHYSTVLQWLDDNLDWTTELGQAYINQQQDVMDSIQRLRTDAYNAGNLQSTAQQQVEDDGGEIEIMPADQNEIYLPDYQPDQVYYQTGNWITFSTPLPIGIWLHGDFDWRHRHLIFWNHSHPRPSDWWHQSPGRRDSTLASQAFWEPVVHTGNIALKSSDRGWDNSAARSSSSIVVLHDLHPPSPGDKDKPRLTPAGHAAPVEHHTSTPIEESKPDDHPATSGAFIGIQSSHETRTYSERGQQSMGTITHSAPAPSGGGGSHSSGGGGASHGGGGGGGSSSGGNGRH